MSELRVISILVKVALMITNYTRQRLGVQWGKKKRSQKKTSGYSIHKGARSRHDAINSTKLSAITDTRCKPLRSSTPNSD